MGFGFRASRVEGLGLVGFRVSRGLGSWALPTSLKEL